MSDQTNTDSQSNQKYEPTLDLSNVGHTMSEGSSSENEVSNKVTDAKVPKKRWVPKLMVEKRRCSSSSDESEKENKKKKIETCSI